MASDLQIKDKSENSAYLKAAPFRKNTRKTEPHKHNSYFEIIYLSRGTGYHFIDNKKFEVRPHVLFFIRQEQVHFWALEQDVEPDGYVVILKKLFFDKSLDGELKQFLGRISKLSCVYLEEHATISQLLELLARENTAAGENSFPIMEGLLKALFVKILQTARPGTEKPDHPTGVYETFITLLTHDHPKKNKVAHYAALLNTTPQNLNAACRKAVGQSAAGVMAESIIDEARRLLAYTENTISEISFTLSFKDPSHFVKYFKRHTSHTPQGFRAILPNTGNPGPAGAGL